uniref:Movement protein n=1 Tax=blackberry leaf mottle-associated virus TaxID=3070201 RepID=A0A482E4S1_9VIRU|nr:movement protein [blackberry leaf mottle-associated virus]
MLLFSVLALVALMMPGTSSGSPMETKINNHEYANGAVNGIDSITELVWNGIRSMHVKKRIEVKAQTQLLPISIYNELYMYYMNTRQRMTRIAMLAFHWVPTSTKFNQMATLLVMDERFMDSSIKSGKGKLLKTGEMDVSLMGNLITAVPFDPNFQQFVAGSLNFATDTMDINKVKFYLTFPDDRMKKTNSVVGHPYMSWKTLKDIEGVYEEVQWDLFTFERKLPPEIELQSGKEGFDRIQNYLSQKYDEKKELLRQVEDLSNALVYGSDQGLSKMKAQVQEDTATSTKLLYDVNKRVEAIRLKSIRDDIADAKSKLQKAMAGDDVDEIEAAKNNLLAVYSRHNIETPKNIVSDPGYVVIGHAQ